jgi:hypothetical protein
MACRKKVGTIMFPFFTLNSGHETTKDDFANSASHTNRVRPRMTHPGGTGYVHGLNTVEALPPTEARFLEDVFFQIADDAAAQALKILLSPSPWNFTTKIRSGWSRFIMSLMVRNPESVQKYKEVAAVLFKDALPRIEAEYARDRRLDDPPTYAEYAQRHGPNPAGRTIIRVIQALADNEELGRRINSMRWTVFSDTSPKFELLTSDRPMLVTNGIGPPRATSSCPSPHFTFSWQRTTSRRRITSGRSGTTGMLSR